MLHCSGILSILTPSGKKAILCHVMYHQDPGHRSAFSYTPPETANPGAGNTLRSARDMQVSPEKLNKKPFRSSIRGPRTPASIPGNWLVVNFLIVYRNLRFSKFQCNGKGTMGYFLPLGKIVYRSQSPQREAGGSRPTIRMDP